jgi:hypothetical protein
MQDNIVGGSTQYGYTDDSLLFVHWSIVHKPLWVTDHGKTQIEAIFFVS